MNQHLDCKTYRSSISRSLCFFVFVGVYSTNVLHAQQAQTSNSQQPNILLILTDDQSSMTLGCYGGKIVPTPNLDRLAAQGARFTDAYVTSQCTPTRATLLSGQYTARNRMWHVIGWYGCPWARMTEPPFLEQYPRDKSTIASELKRAGYTTGIFGKWHLTNGPDGDYQSLKQAAAHHYGFDVAGPRLASSEFEKGGDRGVKTLTEQAIKFIEENRKQPWFCFLSHHMIHGEVVAPDDLTNKYRRQGYSDGGPNRAVYLAGLESIDQSIGVLMNRLEELEEASETIVIFLSDNGGIDERLEHRSLPKPHPLAPKLEPNLREYDNAPLRAGKGSIYEGGVRVPMIVRWPGVTSPGQVIETPVHAIDLAPTIFRAAGVDHDGATILDGKDLAQLLKTGSDESLDRRPIFQYCPFYDLNWPLSPCASIRQGDFKLIEFFGDRFDEDHQYVAGHHVELYNLMVDLSESNNLADTFPRRRDDLLKRLHEWMETNGVSPSELNPNYEQSRAFETTRNKPE